MPTRALQPAELRALRESLLKKGLTETQEVSTSALTGKLGILMPKLRDVESSYSEPEKSLPLDLGLDQIEDC
jgi:hypothetical protein